MRTTSVVILAAVFVVPVWAAKPEVNLLAIEASAEVGSKTISMPFEPRPNRRYEFEELAVLRRTSIRDPFKRVKATPVLETPNEFGGNGGPPLIWETTSESGSVRRPSISIELDADIAPGDEFCVSVRVGGEHVVRIARAIQVVRLPALLSAGAPASPAVVAKTPTSEDARAVKMCRNALKQ